MDTAQTQASATAPNAAADIDGPRAAFSQALSLLRALGASSARGKLAWLSLAIVAAVCANAVAQIRLNRWQGAFYDALEQRDLEGFAVQLGVFLVLVVILLILGVTETWLREVITVRLREWLTHDLLREWLAPRRAYLLGFAGALSENPDQRMHEDARHLSELSADLANGLLRAVLLLVSFIGVLWLLSSQVRFGTDGDGFTVPGYLVWCALLYAVGGSWLTWKVGRPLIAINAERYAREAKLRFQMVRVSECAEGIAMHGGERDEQATLRTKVDDIVEVTLRLANGLARLAWVTGGYGWLALVVPILVAAPGYFQGALSFGGLMMVVGAFNQVQQALRWFVESFPRIADWRATLLRVVAYRDVLRDLERQGADVGRIDRATHDDDSLLLEGLHVHLTDGHAAIDDDRVELRPAERVLIVGEPNTGKSTLFRAIAGLWPWGTGRIRLPKAHAVMFLPQRPYLPTGTLRAALAYPAQADAFEPAAAHTALERVGLGDIVAELDSDGRWDKRLSLDEQQRLVFARLVLHAPRFVCLDDVTSALDEEHKALLVSILGDELRDSAILNVSRATAQSEFYHRTLHLRRVLEPSPLRFPASSSDVVGR